MRLYKYMNYSPICQNVIAMRVYFSESFLGLSLRPQYQASKTSPYSSNKKLNVNGQFTSFARINFKVDQTLWWFPQSGYTSAVTASLHFLIHMYDRQHSFYPYCPWVGSQLLVLRGASIWKFFAGLLIWAGWHVRIASPGGGYAAMLVWPQPPHQSTGTPTSVLPVAPSITLF